MAPLLSGDGISEIHDMADFLRITDQKRNRGGSIQMGSFDQMNASLVCLLNEDIIWWPSEVLIHVPNSGGTGAEDHVTYQLSQPLHVSSFADDSSERPTFVLSEVKTA